MKSYYIMAIILILSIATGYGQYTETDMQAKQEMSKLAFIVGHWEGEGWIMGRDGQRHTFTQTEDIQYKLDSTALLIQGQGMENGKVVHDALAIIVYNKDDDNYTFTSYLASGARGEFKAELKDNKLYWYPGDNLRYIFQLNESGQWYETGEMMRQESWHQFFETTLDKK